MTNEYRLKITTMNIKKAIRRISAAFRPLAVFAGGLLFLASCSATKEIAYFQDLRPGETELSITDPVEITLRPKDKISILVNSRDPLLEDLFNLPIVSRQLGLTPTTGNSATTGYRSNHGIAGYTVDAEGQIDFPVLGKIKVEGMTREEVAAFIKKELVGNNLVKDPVVTVEFMKLTVSVMGEVAHAGQYSIDKDNVTVLDALSMAGDLTIYGKREKVLVLRQENGKQRIYGINLCSGEHIYSSPVYYLQQGDVVYVEPNSVRARQSTVNGNNIRSTSFWVSIASLLTSVCILIFN